MENRVAVDVLYCIVHDWLEGSVRNALARVSRRWRRLVVHDDDDDGRLRPLRRLCVFCDRPPPPLPPPPLMSLTLLRWSTAVHAAAWKAWLQQQTHPPTEWGVVVPTSTPLCASDLEGLFPSLATTIPMRSVTLQAAIALSPHRFRDLWVRPTLHHSHRVCLRLWAAAVCWRAHDYVREALAVRGTERLRCLEITMHRDPVVASDDDNGGGDGSRLMQSWQYAFPMLLWGRALRELRWTIDEHDPQRPVYTAAVVRLLLDHVFPHAPQLEILAVDAHVETPPADRRLTEALAMQLGRTWSDLIELDLRVSRPHADEVSHLLRQTPRRRLRRLVVRTGVPWWDDNTDAGRIQPVPPPAPCVVDYQLGLLGLAGWDALSAICLAATTGTGTDTTRLRRVSLEIQHPSDVLTLLDVEHSHWARCVRHWELRLCTGPSPGMLTRLGSMLLAADRTQLAVRTLNWKLRRCEAWTVAGLLLSTPIGVTVLRLEVRSIPQRIHHWLRRLPRPSDLFGAGRDLRECVLVLDDPQPHIIPHCGGLPVWVDHWLAVASHHDGWVHRIVDDAPQGGVRVHHRFVWTEGPRSWVIDWFLRGAVRRA